MNEWNHGILCKEFFLSSIYLTSKWMNVLLKLSFSLSPLLKCGKPQGISLETMSRYLWCSNTMHVKSMRDMWRVSSRASFVCVLRLGDSFRCYYGNIHIKGNNVCWRMKWKAHPRFFFLYLKKKKLENIEEEKMRGLSWPFILLLFYLLPLATYIYTHTLERGT